MDARGLMMMRLLLNRFHGGSAEPFAKLLSKEEIREILQQDVHSNDVTEIFSLPDEIIQYIHYSWIEPVIRQLPTYMQLPLMSALPEIHFKGLSKMMNLSSEKLALAQPVQTFLRRTLYMKIKGNEHLPLKFLPKSIFEPLLSLNKEQLLEVIDFLGLHDLAEEVRFIVDKNFLYRLFSCLTVQMKRYLTLCMQQRDRLTVNKLELEDWDGSSHKLFHILHRRGLARLGKALSGQNPEFLWYVSHVLDIGRGKILARHYGSDEIPLVTQVLSQQVMNLLSFLKKREAP